MAGESGTIFAEYSVLYLTSGLQGFTCCDVIFVASSWST